MKFGELIEEDKHKVFRTRVQWPMGGVFFLMATMQVPYQLVNIAVVAGIWLFLFFFGQKNHRKDYGVPQLLADSLVLMGLYIFSTFLFAPLASSVTENAVQGYWSTIIVTLISGLLIYLLWYLFIKIQFRNSKEVNWKVKSVI
ncbi:hypothetical protein [Marinilactibacillus piezotolerans]|uniref:hypothetical protein n=1 Tax=Marinilactibacillus piezotolerans TaxID=258723 RepID=UPI0009AFC411|nr:hypothetical protein [Marinilactibacillus piezotolerans]